MKTIMSVEMLEQEIDGINKKIREIKEEMEKAMKPFEEKLHILSKRKEELERQLNKLKHSEEYAYFVKNVKNRKDRMTLKELILKGEGKFSDYRYFLLSGREVEPSISLRIKQEFKNVEEFEQYVKSMLGEDVKDIDYSVSGFVPHKYDEGSVRCRGNTPVRIARELYLNGFVIGYGGEIFVRCINMNRRYVRSVDKIIVVKKEGVKN